MNMEESRLVCIKSINKKPWELGENERVTQNIIPVYRRLRQEYHEFKNKLGYVVNSVSKI